MKRKAQKVTCSVCGKEWWVPNNREVASELDFHKERGCKGAKDDTSPVLMPTWVTSKINTQKFVVEKHN